MEDDKLLTIEETAQKLSVNPMTVRRWIKQGKIHSTRLGEKLLRIKESDLASFVNGSNETPPKDEAQAKTPPVTREKIITELQSQNPNYYLSAAEVAKMADLKTDTIGKMAKQGKIRGIKKGVYWIFDPQDVKEWLEKRNVIQGPQEKPNPAENQAEPIA